MTGNTVFIGSAAGWFCSVVRRICERQGAHETDHTPFRLHSLDYLPFYLPAAAAARMPAGYLFGLLSRSPCGSTHRCRADRLPAGPDVGAGRRA